jgi:type VI secretion system protein ImpJ
MFWQNKVVWHEGMFLRAQHFQQQDRYLEALVRGTAASLVPFPWGFSSLAIDRDLLGTGRFALSAAAGLLEDGTPFAIPEQADHPAPLDLAETVRNCLVYLAAPVRQAGGLEIAADGPEAAATRFAPPHRGRAAGRAAEAALHAGDGGSRGLSRPRCRARARGAARSARGAR